MIIRNTQIPKLRIRIFTLVINQNIKIPSCVALVVNFLHVIPHFSKSLIRLEVEKYEEFHTSKNS